MGHPSTRAHWREGVRGCANRQEDSLQFLEELVTETGSPFIIPETRFADFALNGFVKG